jgi:hypothetical protein
MAWQTPKTNWGQAGQTVPVADDFNRIEENIRVLEAADSLPTTTGTAPNYLVTIPDFIGLKVGRQITIKFHAATSGQAATLNANSLGAKPIIKPGGGNPNIKAGAYNLVYDGVNFQLLGEGGEYGTATPADVLEGKTIGTEDGVLPGTMPVNPSQTATLQITGAAKPTKVVPAGYTPGGTITAELAASLAQYILSGQNIGGVAGTLVLGRKWASGTVTAGSTKHPSPLGDFDSLYFCEVTGLDFKPRVVLLYEGTGKNFVVLFPDGNIYIIYYYSSSNKSLGTDKLSRGYSTASQGGFKLPVYKAFVQTYNWYAYE